MNKKKLNYFLILLCTNVFLFSVLYLLEYKHISNSEKKSAQTIKETFASNHDQIDFDNLLKHNKDVIGWIYMPNTNIDEPVLKGQDNNTYIRSDINGNRTTSGSIFIDEINSRDFSDINTVIYGHNLKSGIKFSSLKLFDDKSYFDSHKNVFIYTPDNKQFSYDIVGFAILNKKNELYQNQITLEDIGRYAKYMRVDKNKNYSNFIMLSTCYSTGSEQRYVVFGGR